MSESLDDLKKKRKNWVLANRENNFEDGIKRLLTDLYPDNAHFIYELLQNAEDARDKNDPNSAGASHVRFFLNKNGLDFEHDGESLFTLSNIEAITGIGISTKRDDPTSIGQFGVGFKSVFAFTNTPEIHSGEFHFQIHDLVIPETDGIPKLNLGEKLTRFIFPFNNPKKPLKQAVIEIEKGLRNLGDNTLLFLSHIRRIDYQLPDGSFGSLERIDHDNRRIEIRLSHPGGNVSISHWLRFEKCVDVTDDTGKTKNCRISIAYKLEEVGDGKQKKSVWKMIPIDGQVSIYFPAEKEKSKLYFHIHAPFASTVARAEVRDCKANGVLRDHLAQLVADSLIFIQDKNLLTAECLAVFPNNSDKLEPFYKPIQNAVISAFQEQPLVPTRSGSHATSIELYCGPAEIANLLGDEALSVFTGAPPPLWAANPPPQQYQQRAISFLGSLEIDKWGWSELTRSLHSSNFYSSDKDAKLKQDRIENWIHGLKDEKLLRFYALLGEAYIAKKAGYLPPFSDLRIIRVATDSGDDHLKTSEVYLQPVEGVSPPPGIRYVKPEVYSKGRSDDQKRYAKLFLEHIGISPFDEKQAILKKMGCYVSPPGKLPKGHLEDIAQFVDLWLKYPSECEKLKEIPFLRGTASDGSVHWRKPCELYLDHPYLDTGLDALFNDKDIVLAKHKDRILDEYHKISRFTDFVSGVGVMAGLEIVIHKATEMQEDKFPKKGRPNEKNSVDYFINYLCSSVSYWRLESSQYCLGKLQLEMQNISLGMAVWRTMSHAKSEQLEAYYIPDARKRHEEMRGPSLIVKQLRVAAWVPDKDGIFRKPADISKEELHPDFFPDDRNGWLTAIGLGENVRKQNEEYREKNRQARREGFKSIEDKEYWANCSRRGIKPEEIERLLAEHKVTEQPEAPVSKPERLRNKMLERKEDASFIERVTCERTVQPGLNADKQAAKAHLRTLYNNSQGELVCQCCRKEMPFKHKNSDLYYFEAVLFVNNLEKRHKENNLALCPTCSAMYRHFRETDDSALKRFLAECNSPDDTPSVEIPIILVGKELSLRFVRKHWLELKVLLGAETV